MNEEIKKKMLEYVEHMEVVVGKMGEFAQQEIPLVIQEYLTWYFYSHLFQGIVTIVLLMPFCIFLYRVSRFYKPKLDPDDPAVAMPLIAAIVLLMIGTAAFCTNLYECVKVSVAPRVVMIETLKEFTK